MINNAFHKKAPKETEAEKPFWISYADLMTALMILFMVIMVVSIVQITSKINAKNNQEQQRATDIKNLCLSIQKQTLNMGVKVDCIDNRIDFGNGGLFDFNKYTIKTETIEKLKKVIPAILKTSQSSLGKNWFKRVTIQGYTDSKGSYLYNLALSLNRSYAVMCSLLDNSKSKSLSLTAQDKVLIKQLFLAGGVAFNDAKANDADSRRVEFKMEFYTLNEERKTPISFESKGIERCELAQ